MNNQESWDNFLEKNGGEFLQSWFWGEFQKKLGKNIWRLKIGQEPNVLQAQIIEEKLPLNKSSFYLARGPVFSSNSSPAEKRKLEEKLWLKIKELSQNSSAVFLRIEPLTDLDFFSSLGSPTFKKIQPSKTLFLDLSPSLEEIFKNLSARSRYNVRLAERKGVKCIHSHQKEENYFSAFLKLIKETGERKRFHPHSSSYFKELLQFILEEKRGELFLAEYQEKIIGAYLVVFWNRQAIDLHGAVDYRYRSTKVAHFLQWEKIKFAKNKNCSIYDFWGIDEKRWPGVTFFKKSFGGEEKKYPLGLEIPLKSNWFLIYQLFRKIKKVCS